MLLDDTSQNSIIERALGLGTLATDRGYEVQRSNNYTIVFPPSSLTPFGYDGILEAACEEFQAPTITVDPITMNRGNAQYKVAGKPTVEIGDLALKDFMEKDTERALLAWFEAVYDSRTQKVGYAVNYKLNLDLHVYSMDGSFLRTWELKGVWPSSFTGGSFTSEGGDKRQITCSLQIDNAWRKAGENSSSLNTPDVGGSLGPKVDAIRGNYLNI